MQCRGSDSSALSRSLMSNLNCRSTCLFYEILKNIYLSSSSLCALPCSERVGVGVRERGERVIPNVTFDSRSTCILYGSQSVDN